MTKFQLTTKVLAIAIFTFALTSLVQAQASRTWVSGVGDDVNPCSRTAPCKTFAGAISRTGAHGEINCLEPGGFGSVTITKSITIDCKEVFGAIQNQGTNGVTIAFDSFGSDTRKTVRLRNINFNGIDTGLVSINITGGTAATGTEVLIEDCVLNGNFGGNAQGIRDTRSGGGLLSIMNTTVRGMGGTGIAVSTATGSNGVSAQLRDVRVFNCAFGISFSNGAKASIFDCTFSGNTFDGVNASSNGGVTAIALDHCLIANNGTGVNASTANTTILVAQSTLANNAVLFNAAGGGQVLSYGDNHTGGATLGAPVAQK